MILEWMTKLEPILLTLVYFIVCICLGLVPPTCPTDENGGEEGGDCGSEGHDNALLSWASDFFVTGVIAFFGVQLYLTTSQKKFATVSYASLFVAYMCKGMVSRYFGNSGMDDGKGAAGYFVLTSASYIFWTLSAIFLGFIAQAAWIEIGEGGLQCGRAESRVALIVMVLTTLIIVTGSLWSLVFSVNTVVDEYSESEFTGSSIPTSMILAGKLLWHAFYCTFLVATAYILRALAKQSAILVGGVSNYIPATGIVLSQAVIVSILLFSALDAVSNEEQWGASDSHTMATVVFNYAMLMTADFVRSFLLALFPRKLSTDSAESNKGMADTDSSNADEDGEKECCDNDEEVENQEEWIIRYKDTENDTLFMSEHHREKDKFEDENGLEIKSEGSLAGLVADGLLRNWASFGTTASQRIIGANKEATNKSIESSLADDV